MDKNKKRAMIRWSVYWLLILGLYIAASIVFGNFVMYLPVPALAAVNFAVRLTVGLCVVIIVNGSNYNDAYINSLDYSVFHHESSVSYNSEDGVYTVRAESDHLKILQLTDVHLCGSITTIGTDRKTIDACYSLIREAQPDLIVVSGDIVYPIPIQTFSKNNLKPIYQFCTFMNNIGIPWAMVYGNHDTESVADYDAKSLEGLFRHFKQQEDCPMLYADKQPDVYGRYNQHLRIENRDGSLNRLIFLVDSNDYVKGSDRVNEYDSVHADQIEWYAETVDRVSAQIGETVKSFVFMHIPFREFADAKAKLDAGGNDAVYLFGKNGEAVSNPENSSGFFDVILEKRSTDAVFVGHDHLNNMGIRYKGVDLVYSKSIDYIAYPGIAKMTDQRGATLITLTVDGGYRIEQVHYNKS